MKKAIAAAILATLHCLAIAEPKRVTAPEDIEKVIAAIPVTDKSFGYRHIGERMANIGLRVDDVVVDRVGKEDAEPPTFMPGDVFIKISTNAPSSVVKAICPIFGSPAYIKRGKKYIPYNRTAYWLMTNRCDFK